jgi:hypothetical protein
MKRRKRKTCISQVNDTKNKKTRNFQKNECEGIFPFPSPFMGDGYKTAMVYKGMTDPFGVLSESGIVGIVNL